MCEPLPCAGDQHAPCPTCHCRHRRRRRGGDRLVLACARGRRPPCRVPRRRLDRGRRDRRPIHADGRRWAHRDRGRRLYPPDPALFRLYFLSGFCPADVAIMAETRALLAARGIAVNAAFVSVDPRRDTPAVLDAFATNIDPALLALTGTPEQVADAARPGASTSRYRRARTTRSTSSTTRPSRTSWRPAASFSTSSATAPIRKRWPIASPATPAPSIRDPCCTRVAAIVRCGLTARGTPTIKQENVAGSPAITGM
jgi:hypothetical protein